MQHYYICAKNIWYGRTYAPCISAQSKVCKKILCCSDGSGTYYSKQFLHIWWFFFQSRMRQMSQSHTVNNHKTKKLAKNKENPSSIYLKLIDRWFQTSQKSNFEYLIQRCYVLLWSNNSNSSSRRLFYFVQMTWYLAWQCKKVGS